MSLRILPRRTIPRMAKNKTGGKGKYKPHRVVRIPERYALLLEELAKDHDETLAFEVRKACRDRLIRFGKLKPPSAPSDD